MSDLAIPPFRPAVTAADPPTATPVAPNGAVASAAEADLPGDAELAALTALAAAMQDDPAALLDLLRRIEKLHRAIQDGPFRDSLPGDRNRLFRLLESMEDSGGWPYIPRLQLRTFMELLQREQPAAEAREQEEPPPLAA